jgi:hypothetical protein
MVQTILKGLSNMIEKKPTQFEFIGKESGEQQ